MRRRKITQLDIDFLCLGIFGLRALPDDMAERIAIRRELARAIDERAGFDDLSQRMRYKPRRRGRSDRPPLPQASLEALAV